MADGLSNDSIIALLLKAGLGGSDYELRPGDLGGNNRIDIVTVAGRDYVIKSYYSSSVDSRDRQASEWKFLEYAYSITPRCVPQPLACLPDRKIALYEYISGKKITTGEIGEREVLAAASFLRDLNASTPAKSGIDLPRASDGFFSISEQIAHLDGRLDKLLLVEGSKEFDELTRQIMSFWQAYKSSLQRRPDDKLEESEIIISPSDFGFHNVLKTPNSNLVFIDFEYAGWDDPAKAICDFFLQPAVPVSAEYLQLFIDVALQYHPAKSKIMKRVKMMRSLFTLKWCCIILNPYLPEWIERCAFANEYINVTALRNQRLKLAQVKFNEITQ
ncbi:phosphotransferase family protein [Terasakiella pusilla]|uniref:phosphotransferase family protein n=1 Tax=Terasakiella pusilla TaxID=64973 RepID=UPI003AA9255E